MATKQFGSSPSGGGLTFGTPSSAPPFGNTFSSAGSTAFGASATPTFGSTAAPTFGSTSTPAFGSTTMPSFSGAPAPNFGASQAPTFSAGTTPAFGATTTSSFGLNFGATSTANNPLSFGAPASSSVPTLGGFNFGSNTIASSAPSLGFSFGGAGAATTTTSAFGLGSNMGGLFAKPATTQATDPAKPAITGLGGVDSSSGNLLSGTNANISGVTGTNQTNPAPKTLAIPAELATTIDSFKANVQQCKQLSSDIARCSIRPLHKVQSDSDSLLRETTELSAELAARRRTANNLRTRAANSLPAAERAHRIAETPHGLEYESGDVVAWITEVVAEGESRLILLRRQLESAQRQLDVSHKSISDEELTLGMRRIHESFVAVAGRLQAVHQQVESQKAQYLSLRRNILKDPTDVFNKSSGGALSKTVLNDDWLLKSTGKSLLTSNQSSAVVADPLTALGLSQSGRQNSTTTGPNPFSHLGTPGFSGLPFGINKYQTASTPNSAQLGNSSWGMSLQSGTAFPSSNNQSPFSTGLSSSDQSPFALQKPPAGNKRGKY